jgi:hypothetical protein
MGNLSVFNRCLTVICRILRPLRLGRIVRTGAGSAGSPDANGRLASFSQQNELFQLAPSDGKSKNAFFSRFPSASVSRMVETEGACILCNRLISATAANR